MSINRLRKSHNHQLSRLWVILLALGLWKRNAMSKTKKHSSSWKHQTYIWCFLSTPLDVCQNGTQREIWADIGLGLKVRGTPKQHRHKQLTKAVFSVLSPVDWPGTVWAAANLGWIFSQSSPGWTLLLLEALPWSHRTSTSIAAGIPCDTNTDYS